MTLIQIPTLIQKMPTMSKKLNQPKLKSKKLPQHQPHLPLLPHQPQLPSQPKPLFKLLLNQ